MAWGLRLSPPPLPAKATRLGTSAPRAAPAKTQWHHVHHTHHCLGRGPGPWAQASLPVTQF